MLNNTGFPLSRYFRLRLSKHVFDADRNGHLTGELVNTIGLAIQMHATATDIATMQFGSQPRLTPSLHPIVAATGDALKNNIV